MRYHTGFDDCYDTIDRVLEFLDDRADRKVNPPARS